MTIDLPIFSSRALLRVSGIATREREMRKLAAKISTINCASRGTGGAHNLRCKNGLGGRQ